MTYFDVSPDGSRLLYSTCRYPTPPDDLENRQAADVSEISKAWPPQYFINLSLEELREIERHSFEITVSNIDGTEPKRLTENRDFDNYPVWSPDGTRIAFASNRSARGSYSDREKLYTMAADGSDLRLVSRGIVSAMIVARLASAWSPDGQHIAFVGGKIPAVYTARPDGSELTKISATLSGPAWSPRGRRVALVAPDGNGATLYTFAYDGSDPVRVTRVADDASQRIESPYGYLDEEFWVGSVSWSPDGSEILVGPYLVNLDSPATLNLLQVASHTESSFEKELFNSRGRAWHLLHVSTSWSPGGSRIATMVAGGTPYIIDRDKAEFKALTVSDVFFAAEASAGGEVVARTASCSGGYVVEDPDNNPGLVGDCETLMGFRNSLAGEASLNWNSDTPMELWYGIEIDGHPPRVTVLRFTPAVANLRHKPLSGIIPPELSELTNLEVLYLKRTELTGIIPSELGNLSNLKELVIYGGEFRGRGQLTGSIPAELGNLSNLEVMDLAINQLTGSIPVELGNLTNLEVLELSVNQLTSSIPAELGKLPNLHNLGVSDNELEGCVTLANGKEVCG